MNASASTQSVGSLKPSTAASNASGKRTRTIIVAHDLPDSSPPAASASATATATGTGLPASASSSSSSSLLGRSAGSFSKHSTQPQGKQLSTYAALGSEADVELYERFLSEKKSVVAAAPPRGLDHGSGTPGSSGGVAAMPPQMLTTTRRAMGQLSVPNNSSSSGKLHVTALPPSLPESQDVGDARQRREAVVQHRKWLKSLPIHERLAFERQQNVLTKWKQINREWQQFKTRTSKKLGKSETQLVMSRASEYREQIEMYDALQRAMPLSEKVGEDFWLVSLRNEGTRYVPVGNIFSGLYCPIRENTKLQPRVRRPLDYQEALARSMDADEHGAHGDGDGHGDDDDGPGRPRTVSPLERRSLEALARKKRRLKKQLHALFPHEVEPSQSGQLCVETQDLFEWASTSYTGNNAEELLDDQLLRDPSTGSLLMMPALDENDQENNGDGTNSRRSTARSRQTARMTSRPRKGPSVCVFLGDGSLEDDSGTHESLLEMGFFVEIQVPQQQCVSVENNGTTALQFQWRRCELLDEQLLPCLTQHHAAPLVDAERIAWTSISQSEGVVLPGETIEFVFTFQSTRAGTWLEKWLLDVDPPIPGAAGTNCHDAAACLRLQCVAVDNFVASTQRKRVAHKTASAETEFMAEQVLRHDIIHKVDPHYTIEFEELSDADAKPFYDAHRRGAYENVQYSRKFMAQCHALYADALAMLRPSLPSALAADDPGNSPRTDETTSPSAATSPRETADAPSPVAVYPLEWDTKLATLQEITLAADGHLENAYMALTAEQLAERGAHNGTNEGEEQEDEGDEEEDDGDEEDDLMEKLLGTKARKKEEQQAALRVLEPHFHDAFQSFVLAAHVSPYAPHALSETLATKLAAMASETPVVLEIARMQNQNHQGTDHDDGAAMLGPLLVRAIDESFADDQQRQRDFEAAKRRFHSIDLSGKTRFTELPALIVESCVARQAHQPQQQVVVFHQVDLDVANWFTLSATTGDGATLEWTLSQKLLDHATHVPPKIQAAVQSLETVLETMAVSKDQHIVLVLVSELSTPPMTKAMKKLETSFATAKATAVTAATGAGGGAGEVTTPPSQTEIEAIRQTLATKRNALLSLRGLECVLQRALSRSGQAHRPPIEFLGSLAELEATCRRDNETHDKSARDDDALSSQESKTEEWPPRVVLIEHLGALARQALKKPSPPLATGASSASVVPAATSPPVADKTKASGLASAADKKKSVVAVAPPPMQTAKSTTDRSGAAARGDEPSDDLQSLPDIPPGMSLEMLAAQMLGQRLAQLSDFLVVDDFPKSWWEATLVHFAAPPPPPPLPPVPALSPTATVDSSGNPSQEELSTEELPIVVAPPKCVLVGPQLDTTFSTWLPFFQSADGPAEARALMKAVVGGRGLEKKLRLLDGLLERVDTIYVVGELAMAILRVLYTKQLIKSIQRERKPVPRFEWQRWIAAVERLMQKAYRKHVELLLPFDFVVGDTRVDLDAGVVAADAENDDEEEGEEDEEEEEEEEEDEDDVDVDDDGSSSRNKKKKKTTQKKARAVRVQKPLEEPLDFDTWQPRASYDGEHGVVELAGGSSWIRFEDVATTTLSGFVVAGESNASLLETTDDGSDRPPRANSSVPTPRVLPEMEWTHRVFDVGPKSTESLVAQLERHQSHGQLFLNGTLGVVEFREFDTATRQLVEHVLSTLESTERLFVTGKSTAHWLRRLWSAGRKREVGTRALVLSQAARNAPVLAYVVESKQHAMLTAFDSV